MAKIPYLPPNNVTLKQIHPVPTTKTITQTLPDGNTVDTVVPSTNYNKKYDIYVAWLISIIIQVEQEKIVR